MADRRNPFHGMCSRCEHVWVICYLPMEVTKAAELMKRAACPMCACSSVFIPSEREIQQAGSVDGMLPTAFSELERRNG